MITNIQYL